LSKLVDAVNSQSDGWAYWSAPLKSSQKLIELLDTAGNLRFGTSGTITSKQLKAAVAPIRRMVTFQGKKQKNYGNSFEFDVDAALTVSQPTYEVRIYEDGKCIDHTLVDLLKAKNVQSILSSN
jgi:hypothetical protein